MRFWRGVVVVTVAVGLGLLASTLLREEPVNNANHPDGVTMICGKCSQTWVLSMRQLSDHHVAHYGTPPPCPHCGAPQGIVAAKDPRTGRVMPERETNPYLPPDPAP